MSGDVSWSPAGKETVTAITVGDEIFVRPDWDAYNMGRSQGHDEMRAACIAAVEGIEHWPTYSHEGDVHACFASDPLAALREVQP